MGSNQTSTSTKDIQTKLGISADGIYGPQTTQAVKDFQSKNGLTVDGIVGSQTLAKLMGTGSNNPTYPTPSGNPISGTKYNPNLGITQTFENGVAVGHTPPVPPGSYSGYSSPQAKADAGFAMAKNVNQPIGVKTQSPSDNIQQPNNTTPNPSTSGPISNNSTDGGTQNTPTTGLYGQLVAALANRSNQSGADYQAAQAEAQRIQNQQTALAQDYAQKTNNIAGTAGFLTQQSGLQGQLNNQYNTVQNALASQYAGATNRLGAANTQQELLQQALNQAAGYAAPQFPSYTSAQFNPAENTYNTVGGGQFGSGPAAISNINSVQQAQSGINTITQNSPFITDSLTRAINLAKSANLDQNSPLVNGLQHAISNGLITNQALTAFQNVINGLNNILQSPGIDQPPIDINTITPSGLAQLQQTVSNSLQSKMNGYKTFLNNYNSGNSSNSSSSSNNSNNITWDNFKL